MIPAEVKPLIALIATALGGGTGFALHKLRQQVDANTETRQHNSGLFDR